MKRWFQRFFSNDDQREERGPNQTYEWDGKEYRVSEPGGSHKMIPLTEYYRRYGGPGEGAPWSR